MASLFRISIVFLLGLLLAPAARALPIFSTGSVPNSRRAGDDPPGVEELIVRARDGSKWVRKRALERLAALREPRGWEVVVRGLADRKGEVADTAEWLLGGLEPGDVRASLLGRDGVKSRDPWVRCRTAEAIGRMQRSPACDAGEEAALLKLLRDREDEVRRMAALSLQRIASELGREAALDLVVPLLGRLAKERNAELRARILVAACVARSDRGSTAAVESISDREAVMRAAGASLLPDLLGGERAAELLGPVASDREPSVRLRAVEALERTRARGALSVLIHRLDPEEEPRILDAIVASLRGLSGMKYRRDPRPWRDWAEGLPEDWMAPPPPPADAEAGEAGAGGQSTSAFLGLALESYHLSFLIDLSGSMWTAGPDGRTRKDRVREALEAALTSLTKETHFNLIPYTERPHALWKKLRPAHRSNVREALRFFDGAGDRGTGNVWDALLLALEDPEVDTLVILTDGAPTGGRRHRLELIAPLLRERTEFRAIEVDAVLVDSTKRMADSWRELTRGTGGRMVSVEMIGD